MKINKNLVEYLKEYKNPKFIKHFYGISLTKKDIKDFKDYSKVTLHRNKGLSASEIWAITHILKRKIEHWIYDGNKPFVVRVLEHYLELGESRNNFKWLSINSTKGGLFTGSWIQVPEKINDYKDLLNVMKQLSELPKTNLTFSNHKIEKENLFAFLNPAKSSLGPKDLMVNWHRKTDRFFSIAN